MMLVYVDIPKVLYSPMKHIIYHPRMIDLVFPEQTIVRELAEQNCFITVVEGCKFSSMQKNVLKEWLKKPVSSNHPVYKNSLSFSNPIDIGVSFWSNHETEGVLDFAGGYQSAVEVKQLSKKHKKKATKTKKFKEKLAAVKYARSGYEPIHGEDADFLSQSVDVDKEFDIQYV